jgi:hypothetical protein
VENKPRTYIRRFCQAVGPSSAERYVLIPFFPWGWGWKWDERGGTRWGRAGGLLHPSGIKNHDFGGSFHSASILCMR